MTNRGTLYSISKTWPIGAFWVAVALASGAPGRLTAQPANVEAHVSVRANGGAISGALVALLDQTDRAIVERITSSSGIATLPAPAGRYRIRVRRIGFSPHVSAPITLPAPGEIEIVVPERRISLSTVVVTAGSACRSRPNDQRDIGVLWEEISKALLGTQLTRQDPSLTGEARLYTKEVTYQGEVVLLDTSRVRLGGARPFVAINPSWLASSGYVHGDISAGWEYFAPDETVLLSQGFADTHCFKIMRDVKRVGQVGLSFEPVPHRRVSDIAGTLWLDEKSSELHEMLFRFVNVGRIERFKPGGRVHFRRLASGAWLVDDWALRFPSLERRIGIDEELIEIGYKENGGAIVAASLEAVTSRNMATVKGFVFDSVANAPLRGARVAVGSSTSVTGQDGSFLIDSVATGSQVISVSHPSLQALGYVSIERALEIAAGENSTTLATPSVATVSLRLCRNTDGDTAIAERGIVHGFVTDDASNPVFGVPVVFHWVPYSPVPGQSDNVARLTMTVRTDSRGHYTACGFRRLSRGDVTATNGKIRSKSIPFSFSSSLLIRHDIVFGASQSEAAKKPSH